MSPAEPTVKRAVVFIDGQNLFHAAREAFGYTYPSYDVRALAECLCAAPGWQLAQTRFYTGILFEQDDRNNTTGIWVTLGVGVPYSTGGPRPGI